VIGSRFSRTPKGVRTLVLGDAGGHCVGIADTGWTLCPPDPAHQRYIAPYDAAEAMALPERTEKSHRPVLSLPPSAIVI
jgi:hypothetical protein